MTLPAFCRSSGAEPTSSPHCSMPIRHSSIAATSELNCGQSGGRLLTLRGSTLLHVAAEYGFFDASRPLLDRGADVNACADIDVHGVGGQTPIFHALTHFKGMNPEVAQLLIARGADLSIRARVPGHYERPGELLDVSAAEYAAIFPLR
jgi:ankyrin repeat protein